MTLISLIVNKLLSLVGLKELAAVESSTVVLFSLIAIITAISGIVKIVKKKSNRKKYAEYTEESIRKAFPLLGLSEIINAVFSVFIGVLKLDTVPNIVIYVGAGVSLVVSVIFDTVARQRLVKKTADA